MTLPRIVFSVDGFEVYLDDWSASASANLGFDQFRALATNARARKVVGGVYQGSVLKAMTETGRTIWEGTVSQPPKLRQDGIAEVAAQGYAYRAAKSGNRVTPIMDQPGAWIPAYLDPINYPSSGFSTVADYPTIVNNLTTRSITFAGDGTGTAEAGMGFYARKMNISRVTFGITIGGGAQPIIRVITGKLPNVASNYHIEYAGSGTGNRDVKQTASTGFGWGRRRDFAIDFAPSDVVIITRFNSASAMTITNPKVWGDYSDDAIYTDLAARIVARQLGWDETGVTGVGSAPLTSSDWVGDAVSYLSGIAGLEDFCWGIWDDRGLGPLMTFGPYGRTTWEISAATGAAWALDPLERVRRVTVQYLNIDNSLGEVTLEADAADQLPDSVDTELKGSLNDQQTSSTLATYSAFKALRRFMESRYRGNITFAHAYESGTRRDAPYEVRPGDLIKIVDFSLDGSITLRIADVSYTPDGISVGIEAPSLGLGGALQGRGGGQAPGQQGILVSTNSGGTATYVVPGTSAGGGGGTDIIPDAGGGGPKGLGKVSLPKGF